MKYLIKRIGGRELFSILAGLGLFSILSFGNMTRWSLWFDESFSVYLQRLSFADIAKFTASDVHPPLYYWVLKIWCSVWGTSELAIRSLSWLLCLVALVTVYLLVRKLFNVRAAQISLLFMAVSPMIIRYSEEARMYALVVAIAALATYMLVAAKRWWHWALYGLLIAAGMLTHYLTLLVWITHWLWRATVVKEPSVQKWLKQYFSSGWLLAHFVAIGLFVSWLPSMLKQLSVVQGNGFWISNVSIDSFVNFLTNTYVYREHGELSGILAPVVVLVLFGLVWLSAVVWRDFDGEKRRAYQLIVMLALVPVLLLYLISLPPLRSTFVDRYVLFSSLCWAVWSGVTVVYAAQKPTVRRWAVGFALVVAVALGAGTSYVYVIGNYNKDNDTFADVRPLVELVYEKSAPNEPLYIEDPWNFFTLDYYKADKHPVFFKAADDSTITTYDLLRPNTKQKVADTENLKSYRRMWYFTSTYKEIPHWKLLQTVQSHEVKTSLRAYELEYVVN